MPSYTEVDFAVRTAAFAFLEELAARHGDDLPWSELSQGFSFRGKRVPLLGPQGIFKPAVLPDLPISITTAPPHPGRPRPYDDGFNDDGTLTYRYRGTDPAHPDNRRLRASMQDHTPLIYFHGVVKGRYLATWPVFVIGDDPDQLAFTVDLDGAQEARPPSTTTAELRRRYAVTTTRSRLHQQEFRVRVLRAYRHRCALCRLRHSELLDAAHIAPDSEPEGEPVVANGLALCKLHHAAFDGDLLGIRPDLVVEIPPAILEDRDGPMLVHGLQGFHESRISVPQNPILRPDAELLQSRYERFVAAQ